VKRVEIICNSALVEDVLEGLDAFDEPPYYSRINNVHGTGSSGPRMGDHIWPEENVIFIFYCDDHEAEMLEDLTVHIKERFPDTGIKCFVM
jgi:nitrogen regulatory protein PII